MEGLGFTALQLQEYQILSRYQREFLPCRSLRTFAISKSKPIWSLCGDLWSETKPHQVERGDAIAVELKVVGRCVTGVVAHFLLWRWTQADSAEQGDSGTAAEVKEEAATSGNSEPVFETYGPGKRGNQLVALASVTVAVGLFLSGRLGGGGPGLPELAAAGISYQEVLFL